MPKPEPKPEWEPPFPICGAKRKEARGGTPCRQKAGAGTEHVGIGACRWHGGNIGNHKKHAVRVEAEARLKTLGVALDVKPVFALEAMVQVSAGAVAWLREQVAELEPEELQKHNGRVLYEMYGNERDRLTRTSKAAVESGVAERQVRLAEAQAEVTIKLIKNVLRGLGLSREQEALAKELVRTELTTMAGLESAVDAGTGGSRLLGT